MSFEDTLPKEINGRKVDAFSYIYDGRGFGIYFRNGESDRVKSPAAWGRIYGGSTEVETSHADHVNAQPHVVQHGAGTELLALVKSLYDGAPVQPLIDWVLENQVLCFGKEII